MRRTTKLWNGASLAVILGVFALLASGMGPPPPPPEAPPGVPMEVHNLNDVRVAVFLDTVPPVRLAVLEAGAGVCLELPRDSAAVRLVAVPLDPGAGWMLRSPAIRPLDAPGGWVWMLGPMQMGVPGGVARQLYPAQDRCPAHARPPGRRGPP